MAGSSLEEDRDRGPGRRSPFAAPSFVASAALMGALAVGGVWLGLGALAPETGPSAAPTGAGQATQAPGSAQAAASSDGLDDSVCGMAAGDQSVPESALGEDTIQVAPGLEVPVVEGVGPGITGPEGVTRCFAHSPTGAVVAAAGFMKWLSSNQRLDEVTGTLMAAGPDRDRLLGEVEASWDGSTESAMTVLGYKTDVRSADEVVVTLAVALPASPDRPVSWPLVMVWEEGDWKVDPPSNNAWGEAAVAGSLADEGYTIWRV